MRLSICFIISTLSLFFYSNTQATHILGGEISYVRTGGLTVCFTIKLYSDPTSPVDTPDIEFYFGDATSSTAYRKSGFPKALDTRVLVSEYEICRSYSGGGVYRAYTQGENRIGNNSSNSKFVIDISFILSPEIIVNFSPQFLTSPIFNAIPNTEFKHNVGGYDAEGDSLSYELVLPLVNINQSGGNFPPGIKINPLSGQITWLPTELGIYEVAVRANKWRNREKIGYTTRDFSIRVLNQNNIDRKIHFSQSNLDFSNPNGVVISPNLSLAQIKAVLNTANPDSKITAISELIKAQKADFEVDINNTNQGEFSWEITNNQARNRPYFLIFRYLQNNGFHKDSTVWLYLGSAPQKIDDIVAGLRGEHTFINSRVFPNPSTEKITIEWPQKFAHTTLQIIDIQGFTIYTKYLGDKNSQSIDIQHFTNGIYIYLIYNRDKLIARGKFIKK
jgi:hypothetical protein